MSDNGLDLCSAYGCNGHWSHGISETIPLCQVHFAEAHASWANHVERAVRATADLDPERSSVRILRTTKSQPVVYYVRMNGKVKIGTTTDFEGRMSALYVQPVDVLAVEVGGRRQESSRHQQFATYRVKGTELFQPNSVLSGLIDDLRQKRPRPWQAGCDLTLPVPVEEWATRAEVQRSMNLHPI